MPAARDVLVDHLLDDVELVTEERQPNARPEQPEPEALEGELERPLLELPRCLATAAVRVRHRLDQQRPPLARAAGDHLAGVDADAELGRPVERLEQALHREGGVQRPLRVVFVRLGNAETAMTASPANFSTVPPARPISSAIAS
jgi:hypothetical protein